MISKKLNQFSMSNEQFKLFNSNSISDNKFIVSSIKVIIGITITVLFGALATWFTWVTHNILLNQVALNTQSEKYSQLNKQLIKLDGSLFEKKLEIDNQISDIKQLTLENKNLIEEQIQINEEKQKRLDEQTELLEYQNSLLELDIQRKINVYIDTIIKFNNITDETTKLINSSDFPLIPMRFGSF